VTAVNVQEAPNSVWRASWSEPVTTAARIRVLVAVDNTALRTAVCDALRSTPDFDVVAETGAGAEAVRLTGVHGPDVLLLDIDALDEDPAVTARRLLRANPGLRVVALSDREDDTPVVLALLDLGVSGYLHKGVSRSALLSAIRDVQEDDERVTLLLARPRNGSRRAAAAPGRATTNTRPAPHMPEQTVTPRTLSTREVQILRCVSVAMSNRQIAARLGITEGTVKQHLRNTYTKLGAVSRIDAVNKAVRFGLISDPTAGLRRTNLR
jgi:DNA-binding NarL/FixJ family response regulator